MALWLWSYWIANCCYRFLIGTFCLPSQNKFYAMLCYAKKNCQSQCHQNQHNRLLFEHFLPITLHTVLRNLQQNINLTLASTCAPNIHKYLPWKLWSYSSSILNKIGKTRGKNVQKNLQASILQTAEDRCTWRKIEFFPRLCRDIWRESVEPDHVFLFTNIQGCW